MVTLLALARTKLRPLRRRKGCFTWAEGEKQAPEPRLDDPPVRYHILHGSSREVFIETADLEKQLTPDGKVARPEIPTRFIDRALLVKGVTAI